MTLILPLGNHSNIDLSKIPGVVSIFCVSGNEIAIHLACNIGDEQLVYENLPKWIHDNMNVTKSTSHVFLKAKKKKKS